MTTTRFAPSPTGLLHLGHAYSAVLGRSAGDHWLLRIEDLDAGRCRPQFVRAIRDDLAWLGLVADGTVLLQSDRADLYAAALERLRSEGLVYPCFCSRADIAAALAAPQGLPAATYPGTCRGFPRDPGRLAREPHSWRLDAGAAVAKLGLPAWEERDGTRFTTAAADFDDVILARKDAPAAYHLACVVDDAASGVDLVVRGADLRPSTPVQRLLQQLLGLPEPRYLHHPLVVNEDGRRLAKRDRAPTLAGMREAGVDGRQLARDISCEKLPIGFRFQSA